MRTAVLGSVLAIQVAFAAPAPQSPGATVSGHVVDADSGAPIADAEVFLQPLTGQTITQANPAPPQITLHTDAGGRFTASVFTPAFALRAAAFGYMPGSYAGPTGSTIRLGEGESLTGIRIRLKKLASIAGVVTDERRQPLRRMAVQAFQLMPTFNGRRLTAWAPPVYTNDKGAYLIPDLPPATYAIAVPVVVTTTPTSVLEAFRSRPPSGPVAERFRSLYDDLGLPFNGFGTRQANSVVLMTSGPSSPVAWSDASNEPSASRIFRTTFHPSVVEPDRARVITVETGGVTGIDVTMVSSSAFAVSGRIMRTGAAADYVGVRLVTANIDLLRRDQDGNAAITVTDADGRFSFLGVGPGQYTLKAHELGDLMSRDPGLPAARSLRHWTEAAVEVGSADAVLPTLHLQPPLTVSGSIVLTGAEVISGSRSPQLDRLPMTLAFNVLTAYAVSSGRSQPITTAGPFAITVGAPGRFDLVLSYGTPWLISAMMLEGRDVVHGVLDIQRSLVDLRITLSNRPGTLDVAVIGRDGRPPAGASVVVFPAHFETLRDVSARSRRGLRSPPSGVVGMAGLPAGEYLVAAFANPSGGPRPGVSQSPIELPDLPLMRRLAPHATRVALADGVPRSVEVPVIDLPDR